jgi:methylamine utilization protein MauE
MMTSLVTDLAPLALGAVLAWSGAGKLFGSGARRQAAGSALERYFDDLDRAIRALRAVGAVELLVALGLLAVPGAWPSAAAACCLGVGFLGYLTYAKIAAPESSCGCSAAREEPVGVTAFVRAALVVAGGVAAAASAAPWWHSAAARPGPALAVLVVYAAVAVVLFTDLHRRAMMSLRRLRIRVFGHPLPADGRRVPLDGTVELLERSLAWEAAAPLIRSGLLDHWEADGWRFLLYSGERTAGAAARRVSVLFALDAQATMDTARTPAVRVTVLDDETGTPVEDALPDLADRTALPLAD